MNGPMDGQVATEAPSARRPVLKWILLGCGGTALVALALGTVFAWWLFHEPPSVDATVLPSAPIRVGEQLRIEVDLKNDDTSPHVLTTIVLEDAYLAGVALEATEPPFKDSQHGVTSGIQMYILRLDVPSGGTAKLTLITRGKVAGQFQCRLGLMFDGGLSSLDRTISTTVLD